jgi:putative Mg2+ transporter-C (MgtC) family protein
MPVPQNYTESIDDFLRVAEFFWPRIAAAIFGGGLIGAENQIYGKAAGLRTSMLVTIGCCVLTIASIETARIYGGEPGRITAQVVTGIGFLGAGVIMQTRGRVQGITTAASIFVSAGIGIVAGSGFIWSSVAISAIAFVILIGLRPVDYFIDRNRLFLKLREIDRLNSRGRRRSKKVRAIAAAIEPETPNE